jgi:hypothetical protein
VCSCYLTTCVEDGGHSVCTDPKTDPLNCGHCGVQCFAGDACSQAFCCPSPLVFCPDAGLCIDLDTDSENCGACGILCPNEARCVTPAGGFPACVCADGGPGTDFEVCSGLCVDFANDSYNCGACGNACVHGPCAPNDAGSESCGCASPYQRCNSLCIDPRDDYEHCGGCTPCQPPATKCLDSACQ